MLFKIDENLPVELAEMLAAAGHDALTVYDQKLAGEPDELISGVCRDEKRAIVTLDGGFANIYEYRPAQFSGIIVLRLKNQDKFNVVTVFHKVLPLFETEPLSGKLWIVDESKVRIRD